MQAHSLTCACHQLYTWSIFNAAGDKIWGTIGDNAGAFTIAVALEGFTACFFGPVIEKVRLVPVGMLRWRALAS